MVKSLRGRLRASVVAGVVEEALAVAHAAHIVLPEVSDSEAAIAGAMKVRTAMPRGAVITRTRHNSRKAYGSQLAKRLHLSTWSRAGVPTPVNYKFYTLLKLLESK